MTAGKISENAPLAVRQAKKSVHYGLQMDLATGYRFEIEAYNQLVDTEDRKRRRARLQREAQAEVPGKVASRRTLR